MDENKELKEIKTFKWGDSEYALDDLLKLHAQYEKNYYDFARERGQYDESALLGLRQAITNRINAVKSGQTFEGDGVLSSDSVDNIKIQTLKKGLFKKEKYIDLDNTEWAKYYLNKLVSLLKPYQKEEKKEKPIDITKYSFENFLKGNGVNAKTIFEELDLQDPNNPEAERAFTQRNSRIIEWLKDYKKILEDKKVDYTLNDNDYDDDTLSTVDDLILNYDKYDPVTRGEKLRKIGAGDAYVTAFTSKKWDLSGSKTKPKPDDKELLNKYLLEVLQNILKDYTPSAGVYLTPLKYDEEKYKYFLDYYGLVGGELAKLKGENGYGTYLGIDHPTWNAAYLKFMLALRMGTDYTDQNKKVLLQRYFKDSPNGFTDLTDGTYLINDSVNSKGFGYIYDPKTGYLLRRHISEFANSNDKIKNHYKKLLYDIINDTYGTNYDINSYITFNEKGGVIKAQLGTAVLRPYDSDNIYTEKAAENGISIETQKAKDNYIDPDNKNALNAATGFDSKAKARIGFAIADLASALASFAPGVGTITAGAASGISTFGNLFVDLKDKAVTAGEAWKNFGMNLGIDLLGLIPGGGAATKLGKVLKGIKVIAPAIIATPGVATMLANSPEIAESWMKAFDGDPENGGSKMTYQDYMNIFQVLNVALGTTSIAGNVYRSAKKSVKQTDKIAVEVTDKNGNRKALVFEGDDVDAFKAANNEGKAQDFINKYEGSDNFKIVNDTKFNKFKPWGKGLDDKTHLRNPFGFTTINRAKIYEVNAQQSRYQTGPKKGELMYDKKTKKPIMNDDYAKTGLFGGRDLSGKDIINFSKRPTVETVKEKYILDLKAKAKAYLEKRNSNIKSAQKKKTSIEATNKNIETTNDKILKLESDINTKNLQIADIIADRKQIVLDIINARARSKRDPYRREFGEPIKSKAEIDAEIDNINSEIVAALQRGKNKKVERNKLKTELEGLKKEQTKVLLKLQELQTKLEKLKKLKSKLESNLKKHSPEFDILTKPMTVLFNGKPVNINAFDPKTLINEGLFKQGGTINRNKINKFLNHEKR